MIAQTTPRDSPGTLVFWRQQSMVDDPPSPWNLRSKWPTPFQAAQFRPIFAHSASTVRASENSSISTNRKSTTRFPASHRWTVYVTPKSPTGWQKTRFCYFFSKFQLLSKTYAAKFLYVKTSSSKVVATSFLYLTVHRWIAGDVPIYLKFALKVTHPVRKRRFRQISLNSAAAVRASENCNYRWWEVDNALSIEP